MLVKKIVLLLLLICLYGCQPKIDMQQSLDEALSQANALPSAMADNKKEFYSFYLEPEVGRLQANETSSILKYKETKFAMNLNISKIVNAQSYGDIIPTTIRLSDDYLIAQASGEYTDYDGSVYQYQSYIYELANNEYYVTLDTQYVFFSAIGSSYQVIDVIKPMMKIAKSISINADAIMVAYSAKERIIFEGEELSLYDEIIPVEGKVSDMIDKPDQIIETDNIEDGTIIPNDQGEEEIFEDEGEYRTDSLE